MAEGNLTEIHRSLGRVEGKIDNMLAQMAAHDDRTTALDKRVSAIENRQYWLSGVGSAIGMLLGVLTGHGFKTPP